MARHVVTAAGRRAMRPLADLLCARSMSRAQDGDHATRSARFPNTTAMNDVWPQYKNHPGGLIT